MTPLSVEPCTLALFGALGDLALRKLFPALYQLDRAGLLPTETRLLALARESGEAASHLVLIEEHLRRHVGERDLDEAVLQRFMARLDYLSMDFRRAEDFAALADKAGNADSIVARSEEHTSELQSLMRISYAFFCLNKNKIQNTIAQHHTVPHLHTHK